MKLPIGVNIEGLNDFARLQPFVDMMKTSRTWGSADAPWDETVERDSLGWPTADAGVVVAVVTKDEGCEQKYLDPGVYKLRFSGKADVSCVASDGVTVSNYRHHAGGVSTANVVVGDKATQMMLAFRNTNGGVKRVTLRRPTYDSTEVFTKEFKAAVAPFGTLRLMDFFHTNGNPTKTWAERTTPAFATQATAKGGAYEHAIQISNQLRKNIWINIPDGVDDDYLRNLARLLKKRLSPARILYVEWSNELWNYIFPQATANLEKATQEMETDPALAADSNYWAAYYRTGMQAVRVSKLFAEVFGQTAINGRVRVVYATQFANPSIAEQVLKRIAEVHGDLSKHLYAVATAPYILLDEDLRQSDTATGQRLLDGLEVALVRDMLPYFGKGRGYAGGDWTNPTHKALADFYGIKHIAYEGGPDYGQEEVNLATKVTSHLDPRMGALVEKFLEEWFAAGNDLFMYFTLTSSWDRYGYWGLTNAGDNLKAPKYAALKTLAQKRV